MVIVAGSIKLGDRQLSSTERLEELRETIRKYDRQVPWQEQVPTYVSLLKRCTELNALDEGRWIHTRLVENGYEKDRYIGNILIRMYANCGNVSEARSVFNSMNRDTFSWNIMLSAYLRNGLLDEAEEFFEMILEKSVVSWNTMITGYAQFGHLHKARELFDSMPEKNVASWNAMISATRGAASVFKLFMTMDQEGVRPDAITFICILDICSETANLRQGVMYVERALACGISWETKVVNAIVNFYGKCGSLEGARKAFDAIPNKDVFSWTSMVTAYSENDRVEEARELFDKMPQKNTASWNTMIAAHAKAGDMKEARFLFNEMKQKNVITWNCIIGGYSQNGYGREALYVFHTMHLLGVKANTVTMINAIDACSSFPTQREGRSVHSMVLEMGIQSEVMVGTALINMYGKLGNVEEARAIFFKLPQKNLVTWNNMLAVYSQNFHCKEGVMLFRFMDLEGIKPDIITYVTVMDACAVLAAYEEGKMFHEEITAGAVHIEDVTLGTSIMHFYAKCGRLEESKSVFSNMDVKNVVTWSAMLTAYAQSGYGYKAIEFYHEMIQHGVDANGITFIGLLFACSHCGRYEDGLNYFISMIVDFNIVPAYEHFINLVNLLGRSGQLEMGEDLIESMPFEPEHTVYNMLLGACKMHGDVERGARIAERVHELEPKNSSPYVILSNIHKVRD